MTEVADVLARDNPFAAEEYTERLTRLRGRMERLEVDALLLTEPADIFYLTGYDTAGYWAYQALVVPADGEMTLVCFIEEGLAAEARNLDYAGYAFGEDHVKTTIGTLTAKGLARERIGIDISGRYLPAAVFDELKRQLSAASIVDASGVMEDERLIKSPAELRYIREASAISNQVASNALDVCEVGVSDRLVSAVIAADCIKLGSDYPAMGPFVRFGPAIFEGHVTWQGLTLEKGWIGHMELAAVRRRYHAPISRYVIARPLDGDLAAATEGVKIGLDTVAAVAAPGKTGAEVRGAAYEAGMDHLRSAGLDGDYLPGGYSIGIGYPPDWTEADLITATSEYVLQPNMAFHMVSFFLFPPLRMGISEVFIVTEDGNERLNTIDGAPRSVV